MIIGIDGTALTIPHPCGVKTYAQNLIYNLAKIDTTNTYFIFFLKKIPDLPVNNKNFHFIYLSSKLPFFKHQYLLSKAIADYKTDVFHFLEPGPPMMFKHPYVITTIHDTNLSYIYPNRLLFTFKKVHNTFSRFITYRKTKMFVTPTEFSKEKLVNYKEKLIMDEQIQVIPHGISSVFSHHKKNVIAGKKHILIVGDGSPRKNISKLIDAYSRLTAVIKEKFLLVVALSSNIKVNDIENKMRNIKIQKQVTVYKDVNPEKLVYLYRNAVCLVFASLYEDFGLPIIEAMACGCPVITSDLGAMKETAGGAAYLVNPRSTSSITKGILRVVNDKQLQNKLREKGLKRASRFTWEETAIKTLNVYENALKINTTRHGK
jgi:glycosyltransferase involved in cell wall biosynthesis